MMNEVVSLIGNVGFPMAITLYVLIRLESKMEKLSDSMNKLANAIEVQKNQL
ncbi:YvrJ family protein [Peptostreptococcaceae bacterium AS15]|nr:hypothetical protein HMPREF0379_0129 [[Eubacterium] yurii subsp. margaretiae ATCC 43715]EJP26153.1 YvrJ family protein [Peptostreptococcaceae bacterium AS15]